MKEIEENIFYTVFNQEVDVHGFTARLRKIKAPLV